MSLDEYPKPQLRPQPHRLDYSPVRPWEGGLVRLRLDPCLMETVGWHMRVVLSCWSCGHLLCRVRKQMSPRAKGCGPKLSVLAEIATKHCAASKTAVSGKGSGPVLWGQQLWFAAWAFWATVEQPLKLKSPALPAPFSYMPWPSSPTRGKGSLEVLTFAHVYLCSNRGLLFNIVISNSSIHFPANGSILFFIVE